MYCMIKRGLKIWGDTNHEIRVAHVLTESVRRPHLAPSFHIEYLSHGEGHRQKGEATIPFLSLEVFLQYDVLLFDQLNVSTQCNLTPCNKDIEIIEEKERHCNGVAQEDFRHADCRACVSMVIGGLRFQVERAHSGHNKPCPNDCANVQQGHRSPLQRMTISRRALLER